MSPEATNFIQLLNVTKYNTALISTFNRLHHILTMQVQSRKRKYKMKC